MGLLLALAMWLSPEACVMRYVRIIYAMQTTESRAPGIPQIDPALIFAVILNESGCDPTMAGDAGEVGLMQILPQWSSEDLADPAVNIRRGAHLLDHVLHDPEHNPMASPFLALAAYNCGWDKLAGSRCGRGGYAYARAVYEILPEVRAALDWYAAREWTEPRVARWLNAWGYGD